ncbi:hypothetical protein Q31b_18080 [Novipirellula aureliae]|uniref:Secreted protein n=1 Tax=Novipirellula aureliae TaxID=2527966 RepID=A0A5C6E5T5_9BACT|nr:hypothetical protein [Novipirellula aureliae]TWU44272.1 hypothetical protein Q31b_18080 [Novipirellula aureliae]
MKISVLLLMVSLFAIVGTTTGCGGSEEPTVVKRTEEQMLDYEARIKARNEAEAGDR